MIGSPEINKTIRRILSPSLREAGFNKVNSRQNWAWIDHCIWVLEIRAVGKYFSDVTGWPPMSINVDLGIYYDFIPSRHSEIKIGTQGELLPKPFQCHLENQLNCHIDQASYKNHLANPAEKERKDIWWVEPDGSNIEEVITDIKNSFSRDGLEWFRTYTNLKAAFNEIENQHNSLQKFYKAKYFAEYLKDSEKINIYTQLFDMEQKRINM